jgi:hypothetical protein
MRAELEDGGRTHGIPSGIAHEITAVLADIGSTPERIEGHWLQYIFSATTITPSSHRYGVTQNRPAIHPTDEPSSQDEF